MAGESRFVEVCGSTIHVRIDGEPGRPWLTALHALATDLHLWDGQIADWTTRFRLLRLDLPGHGRSPAGQSGPVRIADFAEIVVAVWRTLGVERSALAGLSIGGMIALEIGLAQPAMVSGLLAADCRADAPAPFRAMWDARRALLAEGGLAAVADATLPTWFTPETLADAPDRTRPIRAMIEATSPDGYVAATLALQHLDILPRLDRLRIPVRYVVGERDGVHPEAMAAMVAQTPGATLAAIPAAAHLSNIEQPAAFAAATLSYLEEIARDAAPTAA